MDIKLPRRLIRDIAGEYSLRHSPECRAANPRGTGSFTCRCDFFQRVEEAIFQKHGDDYPRGQLLAGYAKQHRDELHALAVMREQHYETMRSLNAEVQRLEQKIGDIKITCAVDEVMLRRFKVEMPEDPRAKSLREHGPCRKCGRAKYDHAPPYEYAALLADQAAGCDGNFEPKEGFHANAGK